MRGQQLGEEVLLGSVGPVDHRQAFAQVLHQPRQAFQELGAVVRRGLRLQAHHQVAAGGLHALELLGLGAVADRRLHQHLAPDLRQEISREVIHLHLGKLLAQRQHVALLQAQRGFFAREHRGRLRLRRAFLEGRLCDQGLQFAELGVVQGHLVEVAFDDVLHEIAHPRKKVRAGSVFETFESHRQRRQPVHEAPYRMLARTEKAHVLHRRTQHRQLQPREHARHLRRHLRVGQHLVEQRRDDVDDHVIQRARRHADQLVAVHADQVRDGVAGKRRGSTGTRSAAGDRRTQRTRPRRAARCGACAVGRGRTRSWGRTRTPSRPGTDGRIERTGHRRDRGQPAHHAQHLGITQRCGNARERDAAAGTGVAARGPAARTTARAAAWAAWAAAEASAAAKATKAHCAGVAGRPGATA
jgi:hypothetical protein